MLRIGVDFNSHEGDRVPLNTHPAAKQYTGIEDANLLMEGLALVVHDNDVEIDAVLKCVAGHWYGVFTSDFKECVFRVEADLGDRDNGGRIKLQSEGHLKLGEHIPQVAEGRRAVVHDNLREIDATLEFSEGTWVAVPTSDYRPISLNQT